MTLCAAKHAVKVLLKQEPTSNQVHRRGADSLQVVVEASVSLFN
jgi:hypothetical protein